MTTKLSRTLVATSGAGTGDLPLDLAQGGYFTFAEAIADTPLVYGGFVHYGLQLPNGSGFEYGVAQVVDAGGPSLARSTGTVTRSTNGGSRVDVPGSGVTVIWVDAPMEEQLLNEDRASQGGSLAETNQAQTFVGSQSVLGAFTVRSDDTGSAEGPIAALRRNSASPAANDLLGVIQFNGNDDAAFDGSYAKIGGLIRDPAAGSEDGGLLIEAIRAGVHRVLLRLTGDGGIGFFGAALQGDNTANFPTGGLMVNGVAIAQGAMQHLRTETVSGTPSTLDFTADITDTYDTYLLIIDSLTLSADTELRLRCGDGAFDAGASDYGWSYGSQSGSINDADNSASEIQLTNDVGAGAVHSGQILITRARTAGNETFFTSAIGTHTTSSQLWDGASRRDTAAAIDRVRLFVALGTFTAGDVQLFGVAT